MRIKVSEPTNGSDMILKASAAKGSSSEACRTIGSSEPILTPLIAGTSVGAGRESTTASSSGWTPLRSEEHTSELQSQSNLVCRLLLEKKKSHHRKPLPHS